LNVATPLLSIIVPVYNGSHTIAACLDSLLSLDYPREQFEIVVVNNASTDRTAEILATYRDRARLLEEKTRGPSAARNRGILEAGGKIIAMTDADCVVDRHWLRNLVQPLEDESVGIVGGRILSRKPCNRIEKFGETIHDHQKAIEVFKPPYVITMNWASPRKVLLDTGLFDETYIRCEDVDLSQRVLERGYRLVYEHRAVVFHRNERSLTGLFREGFQHGKWSVKHSKHHCGRNRGSGRRRINFCSYREIGANLWAALFSTQRVNALCQATFDTGKNSAKRQVRSGSGTLNCDRSHGQAQLRLRRNCPGTKIRVPGQRFQGTAFFPAPRLPSSQVRPGRLQARTAHV
jgi:glycosyltransferase involved in cell wall biosynthesis